VYAVVRDATRAEDVRRILREGAEESNAILKRGHYPGSKLEVWRGIAEDGDAEAQNEVGVIFANGNGAITDPVEAHAWFNLASAGGSERAKENLRLIERTMSQEQIAEATKLAKIYHQKFGAK
jgi:TPR repeat protein